MAGDDEATGSKAVPVAITPANKKSRRDAPMVKSPSLLIVSIHDAWFEDPAHHHDHRIDLHGALGEGRANERATLDDRDGLRGRECADPAYKPIQRKGLSCDAKV